MFKRKHIYTHTDSGIPLFFKLWFAFCAILAIATLALMIFAIYTVISDPSVIGSFVAEIMNGYNGSIMPVDPGQ